MGYSESLSQWSSFLLIVTVTLLQFQLQGVESYFEYCSKDAIVTVQTSECPYGVLFNKPQTISTCMFPTSGDHKPNICSDDGDTESSKRVQFIDVGPDDEDGPNSRTHKIEIFETYSMDTCKASEDYEDGSAADKCPFEYVKVTTLTRDGDLSFDEFSAESNNSESEGKTDVKNQTLRLFMYMQDLLVDQNENLPNLRLITLLEKSFDVLRTHCPTKYVSESFTREIRKAFLYLLRESDLRHVKDISVNQYAKISSVLDKCLNGPKPPKPFYLNGLVCKAKSKINSITKTHSKPDGGLKNITIPYKKDRLSFRYGRYDVPVDATWGIMDFTHGMCYGMFNLDVNSHHLYEQALERLFTTELIYRWSKPPKLNHEYYWNHLLRTHVNVTMRNLDACIQASYMDSPFLHRLYRPMVKQQVQDTPSARKKRDADEKGVWCFKSQEEKEETIQRVKTQQCDQGIRF